MRQRIEGFLSVRSIAVVGATDKREKWGYKILSRLRSLGYDVLPIHPTLTAIDGLKAYATLRDLPKKPDAVSIVVPPSATERAVRLAKELRIGFVWIQPGAESDEAIEFCDDNALPCVHNKCILVETAER